MAVVFPVRGWWRPVGPSWAGRAVPGAAGVVGGSRRAGASGWVPVVVVGRASGRGPRSWAVVFPAGVPVGGGGVGAVPGSAVRLAAAGPAGAFGRAAWSAGWSALGGAAWSAVWPGVSASWRVRWAVGVPGSLAAG